MSMSQKEAKQNIEAVHAEYTAKLNALKREQDEVIKEFMAALEKAKVEEIKRNIYAS